MCTSTFGNFVAADFTLGGTDGEEIYVRVGIFHERSNLQSCRWIAPNAHGRLVERPVMLRVKALDIVMQRRIAADYGTSPVRILCVEQMARQIAAWDSGKC